MFTIDELASYLGEPIDLDRGTLIRDLTLGVVYDVLPPSVALASSPAKAIGLEVAARAIRNAEGYASERVDDYTYQRPATTQEAGVYLTEDERSRLLWLAAGKPRKRVRSVRMSSWSVPQL